MRTERCNYSSSALTLCVAALILGTSAPLRPLHAQTADRAAARPSVHVDSASDPDPSKPSKTFFTRNDAIWSGVALGGSAILSIYDERIGDWFQSPSVQNGDSRMDLANSLTKFNEQPLAILTVGGYAIGKLTRSETLADIAGHSAEALALSVFIAEAIRVPLGRARPRISPDDQYNFEFMKGWSEFQRRAFPSLHAAAAYSVASALVGEIKIRKPEATPWAAPVLYTVAAIPGLTRMYLNQHWASDVAAGTFLGVLLGSKVVQYAHSHDNKVDKILGIASIVPDGRGGAMMVIGASTNLLAR